jgi:hypothetical protein
MHLELELLQLTEKRFGGVSTVIKEQLMAFLQPAEH